MSALAPLWLPLAVAGLAALVLVVDAFVASQHRRTLGWLTAAALAGLLGATWLLPSGGSVSDGAWTGGPWTLFLQRLFLAAALVAVLGALDHVSDKMPRRAGEYWLMLLLSLAGMTLLPGARDLLLLVVAFELMGLPLYVLAAWAKTDGDDAAGALRHAHGLPAGHAGRRASEAALKLYLTGVTSTALTLFGLGLLVGMTGTTRLAALATAAPTPLSSTGLLLVLAGLGFKIGMVPFHMWVPDTYEGAPTPFVAFLSVAPKAAGVAAIAIVFLVGASGQKALWMPPLAVMALAGIALGNLLALPQTDVRRLLAWSGIAQMGYLLVALAGADAYATGMALFFLAAYVFTNMGAFLVAHAVAEGGSGHDVDGLAGLARRAPGMALALLLFLLSLAGIPFVVGFWAKLYVFLAAWRAGLAPLVVAAVALAAIGLFYYLRVANAAYMKEPGDRPGVRAGLALRTAIAICALAVAGIGLWPRPLVDGALAAGSDFMNPIPTLHIARR